MPHPTNTSTGRPAHGIGSVKPDGWAYHRAPMIVYWELTNACGLACRHCRATAMPDPMPGELTTAEAIALLDDLLGFAGPGEALPHVVMTGAIRCVVRICRSWWRRRPTAASGSRWPPR